MKKLGIILLTIIFILSNITAYAAPTIIGNATSGGSENQVSGGWAGGLSTTRQGWIAYIVDNFLQKCIFARGIYGIINKNN